MTDKTTIKAYDVPINTLNTPQDVKGSTLLAINPTFKGAIDPDKNYPTTPTQMSSMRASFLGDQQKQALIDLENKKVAIEGAKLGQQAKQFDASITRENRNEMLASGAQIGENIKVLQERIKDPTIDPAAKDEANKQVDELLNTYKSIREKLYPGTTFKKNDLSVPENGQPKPNAAIPPTRYDVGLIGKGVTALSNMPKADAMKAIDTATTYSDAEKIALRDKLNNPAQPDQLQQNLPNASQR